MIYHLQKERVRTVHKKREGCYIYNNLITKFNFQLQKIIANNKQYSPNIAQTNYDLTNENRYINFNRTSKFGKRDCKLRKVKM